MKQCKQCGVEFEAKRNDAKFCSAKCRVTFNRVTVNVTDKRGFVPVMVVPDTIEGVTVPGPLVAGTGTTPQCGIIRETGNPVDNIQVQLVPQAPIPRSATAFGELELGTMSRKSGISVGTSNVTRKVLDDAINSKPTAADLPLDVQRAIDKMCSENNNGERAGSHSRAAMTERALSHQTMTGRRLV